MEHAESMGGTPMILTARMAVLLAGKMPVGRMGGTPMSRPEEIRFFTCFLRDFAEGFR